MINSTPNIPVGKWIKCEVCGEILYKEHIRQNVSVCTNCGNHVRLSARRRIKQIVDETIVKVEPFKLLCEACGRETEVVVSPTSNFQQ